MPAITAPVLSVPAKAFPGQPTGVPSGVLGELVMSEVMGKYATLVKAGKVQIAYATLAAASPTIFSTNTLTGGPIVWNRSNSQVEAHVLGMGVSVSVASTVAGSLGLTGGPSTIPTAATAIDFGSNAYIGGPASQMVVSRTSTPSVAGTFFLPMFNVGTTALTAMFAMSWIDAGGLVICGPGNFVAVAASATMTTMVASIALVWAELPV